MTFLAQEAAVAAEAHFDESGSVTSGRTQTRPVAFGHFLALPGSRTLLCRGTPVELGGRAFDLLMVLLRTRGTVVARDQIVRYVWPSTIVEESNLRFQVACLRRALGEARAYIKTVQGRGYLFIGEEDVSDMTAPAQGQQGGIALNHVGHPAIFVIDEDDVIRAALERLLRSFDAHVTSFTSLDALLESTSAFRHA